MKGLTIPFSIFDFFAVLFPGGLGIFGLYIFMNPTLSLGVHQSLIEGLIFKQINGDFIIISILIVSSYLMGLILNAIADIIIDKPANYFGKAHIVKEFEDSEVKRAVLTVFGHTFLESSFSYRHKFSMVESIVGKNTPDAAMMASKYIALAAMFESLMLSVLIVLLAILKGHFTCNFHFSMLSLLGIITSFGILLYVLFLSYRKYKSMWSRTIVMSFLAWVKLSASK